LNTMQPIPHPKPNAKNFKVFDDIMFKRMVGYTCRGDCSGQMYLDSIFVHKYTRDDSVGALTMNGANDETGACALPGGAGCDFAMRHPFIYDAAAPGSVFSLMTYSESYLGKTTASVRNATDVVDANGGVPVYDEKSMSTYALVDPLTGQNVYTHMTFQVNTRVIKSFLDGPLHANLFAGETSEEYEWPRARLEIEQFPDSSVLRDAVNLIGWFYSLMLWQYVFAFWVFYLLVVMPTEFHLRTKWIRTMKARREGPEKIHVKQAPSSTTTSSAPSGASSSSASHERTSSQCTA